MVVLVRKCCCFKLANHAFTKDGNTIGGDQNPMLESVHLDLEMLQTLMQ